MSALKVTTKEGMIEHVESLETEPTNLLGGSDSTGTRTNRSPGRAFAKRGNSHGESSGSDSGSQSIGDIDVIGSDRPIEIPDGGTENGENERNSGSESGTGSITGSGNDQSRSGGNRYGIEPRRAGESANDYSKRYKREYRAAQRAERERSETEGDYSRVQIDPIEAESAFSVTVEAAPIVGGESLEIEVVKPGKESKASPRAKRGSKYKEPAKDAVTFTASMLKDVYGFSDGALQVASILMNKFYVPGTMELDDEKAEKLAHALVRMNSSLPQLAEKINKYSAPATFFSILITDLVGKGMMINGMWKQSPKSHS